MTAIIRPRSFATRQHLRLFMLALAAAALPWSAARADDGAQDIEARYRNEIAACERAPASEDQAACRREAAAAREEARRGVLGNAPGDLERNALARCEALPEADRDLCRRRTRGEGVTKGSVAEGGIYREYREATLPEVTPREGVAPANPSSGGQPGAAQGR